MKDLKYVSPIWYVDFEHKIIKYGVIQSIHYEDKKIDTFFVVFGDGSIDEFLGEGLGEYLFDSLDSAKLALLKGNTKQECSDEYDFIGYLSGDYESFCWDVNLETFINITGRNPDKYSHSEFNDGMYRIYPNDLYKSHGNGYYDDKHIYKTKVTVERIDE